MQQSISLDPDTVRQLEAEAKRLGLKKSQYISSVLRSTFDEQTADDEGKPTVISVMSYKGGVGKTTTSVSLAICLAADGHRVLIVDLDRQGNASQYLRVYDPRAEDLCVADVLLNVPGRRHLRLDEVICQPDPEKFGSGPEVRPYGNIWVAPSNFRFADADALMKSEGVVGADTILRYAIEDMEASFDYIIVDCGPRLDSTAVNAIVALEAGDSKSRIVLPVKMDGFAIAGLHQTVRLINKVAQSRRMCPQPWAILQTQVEAITKAYKVGCEELKRAVPDASYFNAKIPKSTVVPESNLAGVPLITYDPLSKPALAYIKLANEIEGCHG